MKKLVGTILLVVAAGAIAVWFRPDLVGLAPDDKETTGKGKTPPQTKPPLLTAGDTEESPFHFTNVASESGVKFTYKGSPTAQAHMTEQNGGGAGLFDFDNDGRLDLFLVNGAEFGKKQSALASSHRLYRGNGDFTFADATTDSGMKSHGFGMGCAAADYDNDGFTDVFVAAYGKDRLWQNNGDGTFTETTDIAGVGCEKWGTSAAFADLDADGLTDLYVVNYVDWSPDGPPCTAPGNPNVRFICSPMQLAAQPDVLYRNNGDGTFTEFGANAGVTPEDLGKGLALSIADLNDDGQLDIYVANDTTANSLFINQQDMKFEDQAVIQGVAISADGAVGAGMGVACADCDGNGFLDLAVTNFRGQVNDIFSNLGPNGFVPASDTFGMDAVSKSSLGFGIMLADFNMDSRPDMLIANGHIHDYSFNDTVESEYKMRSQVLLNKNGKRFTDVSANSGDYFNKKWLARSIAIGDIDNDGDPDAVITHLFDPPALLRNDSKSANKGTKFQPIGTTSARESRGAKVRVKMTDRIVVSHVPAGTGFQAFHDRRVLTAVPANSSVDYVEVHWPGGSIERWNTPAPTTHDTVVLIEGTGTKTQAAE